MFEQIQSRAMQLRPYIPTICFLCGSTWDWLTLKRIDSGFDSLIFSTYLLLSGVLVVLMGRWKSFRYARFFPNAAQIFFGGLLSASTVYYFKSADSLPSLLFILALGGLLIGNEFLEKRYSSIQVAFFFWSICAFTILNLLVPVVLKMMNHWIFFAAVALALGLAKAIRHLGGDSRLSMKPTVALYAVLVAFYFLNVIPPVPLAAKHTGIYHSVKRSGGEYVCMQQKPRWYQWRKDGERVIRLAPSDTLFCFGAVFAPGSMHKSLYHHWYYKNPSKGHWEERGRMGYRMVGGRDKGFRGYTYKRNHSYGQWKVVVKTEEGRVVSVAHFRVAPPAQEAPELVAVVH